MKKSIKIYPFLIVFTVSFIFFASSFKIDDCISNYESGLDELDKEYESDMLRCASLSGLPNPRMGGTLCNHEANLYYERELSALLRTFSSCVNAYT